MNGPALPRVPVILTVLLAGFLPGCLGLSREPAEQHHFVLAASRPASESPAAKGNLEVRPFYVAEAWAGKAFVYRTRGDEVETDFHRSFLVAPGSQLAGACLAWLQRSGIFAAVHAGGSRVRPTHSLEVDVTELCGDFRGQPAKAILALHAVLLGAEDAVVLQKDYRVEESLPEGADPAQLVQGWNRALAQFLAALEGDLRAAVGPVR